MKFNELILCIAIENSGRCSDTPKTIKDRNDLASRVMGAYLVLTNDSLFPFTTDEIVVWDSTIRKNKNTQMKIEIAIHHGMHCFWKMRDKGPCCSDVEAGHLVAACKGGDLTVANGVIECRSHNNQRREMTIEEYINSDKRTV